MEPCLAPHILGLTPSLARTLLSFRDAILDLSEELLVMGPMGILRMAASVQLFVS